MHQCTLVYLLDLATIGTGMDEPSGFDAAFKFRMGARYCLACPLYFFYLFRTMRLSTRAKYRAMPSHSSQPHKKWNPKNGHTKSALKRLYAERQKITYFSISNHIAVLLAYNICRYEVRTVDLTVAAPRKSEL